MPIYFAECGRLSADSRRRYFDAAAHAIFLTPLIASPGDALPLDASL